MNDDEVRDEDELGENTFDAHDFGGDEVVEDDVAEDAEDAIEESSDEISLDEALEEEEALAEEDDDDFDDGYSEFNDYEE